MGCSLGLLHLDTLPDFTMLNAFSVYFVQTVFTYFPLAHSFTIFWSDVVSFFYSASIGTLFRPSLFGGSSKRTDALSRIPCLDTQSDSPSGLSASGAVMLLGFVDPVFDYSYISFSSFSPLSLLISSVSSQTVHSGPWRAYSSVFKFSLRVLCIR